MFQTTIEIPDPQRTQTCPPPVESADHKPPISSTAPEATQMSSKPPRKAQAKRCCVHFRDALVNVIVVLTCIVLIPIYLIIAAVAWFFCLNVSSGPFSLGGRTNKHFYQKVQEMQQTAMRYVWLSKIISRRLVILSLTWLTVNLSVPGLKKRDLLGSELWKWTLLAAVVLCGYNIISLATRFFLLLLFLNKKLKGNKIAEYYARGLRHSVNLVAHTGAILLTWIFYFSTSRGIIRKPDDGNEAILNAYIGTWTFVALTTAAWLWLLKNFLLLKWEADAVYNRFSQRILNAGVQLYFVSRICDLHLHIFQPRSHVVEDKATPTDDHQVYRSEEDKLALTLSTTTTGTDNKVGEAVETTEERNKEREEIENKVKNILYIDKDASTYRIKQMTKYFVALSEASSREDDGTSDVLDQCKKIKPKQSRYIKEEDLSEFKLEKKDAEDLYKELSEEHGSKKEEFRSEQVSYEHFEKWMVKAQKNCVALGRTLSDARGVVSVLDKVLTAILIAIAIIAWLLLTDIASTKILVLIASPLLATVFVFGDTCKKIFEGIIFSFINHPFDVGDRCIIDKTELEVKRMSVLATTFISIGTKEEALYPNSALATMPIVNLKGEPDPNDNVELTLDLNYTKPMLDKLQDKITRFIEDHKGMKSEKATTVTIKEIGESSIKMVINYQHVMKIHETTHSQCLEKKRNQRSELLLQIKQFTDDINTERPKRSLSSLV